MGGADCAVVCEKGKWLVQGDPKCKAGQEPPKKKKKKKKPPKNPKPEGKPPRCEGIKKPETTGTYDCMEHEGFYGCALHCDGKKVVPYKTIVCKCKENCNDKKAHKRVYAWYGNGPHMQCPKPETCENVDLVNIRNGIWICTGGDEMCSVACDAGYEGHGKAMCKKGQWRYDGMCKCVKTKGPKPPKPDDLTPKDLCPWAPQPVVDNAYWYCKTTGICFLTCLNGHVPTNKHGHHVAIQCRNNKWWANDPCVGEMCPTPPTPVDPPKEQCKKSNLPNVKRGYWRCHNPDVCVLMCENGHKTDYKFVCKNGDWMQKTGKGKCKCPADGKPDGKPDKPKPTKPPKPEP